MPIREEDRHITACGIYVYIIASDDGYTRPYDESMQDISTKTKCLNEVLIRAESLEESFHQTFRCLDIYGQHDISLNPEKFALGKDVVKFAGCEITSNCALHGIPTGDPGLASTQEHHRFVNQVSYAFSTAEKMLACRQLLKSGTPFK